MTSSSYVSSRGLHNITNLNQRCEDSSAIFKPNAVYKVVYCCMMNVTSLTIFLKATLRNVYKTHKDSISNQVVCKSLKARSKSRKSTWCSYPIRVVEQGNYHVIVYVPCVIWGTASHDINAVYSVENITVSNIMKLTM